jgi:hypothetical protein
MIVEYIRYSIEERDADRFNRAYEDAGHILQGSPHCLGFEVSRCAEDAKQFIVRIEWDSLDGHLKGFRASPEFGPFFATVKPFYNSIQEMRHYVPNTRLLWSSVTKNSDS